MPREGKDIMGESTSHFAVVDAIEDDTVVLLFDRGPKLHLDRSFLPPGTRESTVLRVTFAVDDEEKARRVGAIQDLSQRLLDRTRNRGGR